MFQHSTILTILGCVVLKLVTCGNMMGGTELVGNPYDESVYIQQKPATTICHGTIVDEETVYTSALCEIGTLSVDNYHVVEAPRYKTPPPYVAHNIKIVQRGKNPPFDLKVIKLSDPFHFGGNSNVTKVLWVEAYDDFTDQFNLNRPAVVLSFGPPFKGGVVSYKITNNYDCKQDYQVVKEPDWPDKMPLGGFCVYEGTTKTNVSVPHKRLPVTVDPGVPGDDSVGSLVKIEAGYGRTLGIVIKAFYGTKKVTVAWGSYYLLNPPFEPDPDWNPPTPPTSTSTSPSTSPSTSSPISTTTIKVTNTTDPTTIRLVLAVAANIFHNHRYRH